MEAVAEILVPCGVNLGIKWPNDLVAHRQDGALVKIGGIIGEQKTDCVILGLGLNIHSAPEMPERAIPPASLVSLGAGSIPSIIELAQNILYAWQDLDMPRQAAFRWPVQGDRIQWEEGSGVCQGWQDDGRLAVQTQSGMAFLASGDVRGMMEARSAEPAGATKS
jgi:BirA family biotin operon repressor/biotin-[acetyl-CoA-carboxylase] ligase